MSISTTGHSAASTGRRLPKKRKATIRLSNSMATPITPGADMPRYDWLYSDKLPDGHRLFYTNDPKQIAIADDSGEIPEYTVDGVVWVDFSTPLGCRSAVDDDNRKTICRIPITYWRLGKSHTI